MSEIVGMYKEKLKRLDTHETDLGCYHSVRDRIYEDFIKDVSKGIFKDEKEIIEVSVLIKKDIIDQNISVWYE